MEVGLAAGQIGGASDVWPEHQWYIAYEILASACIYLQYNALFLRHKHFIYGVEVLIFHTFTRPQHPPIFN